MSIQAAVVRAIRAHLTENKITQVDVARSLGWRAEYVANVLSERTTAAGGRATFRALQRIADVLGVDVEVAVVDRREVAP